MAETERMIRIVKLFGNGAHVFVPRGWVGEQILIERPEKKNLKEKILYALSDYLEFIVGVYLYGSHARGEQTPDSDIDLLVLTDKKLKIKVQGFEIISLPKEEVERAVKLTPLLIHSILSEGKSIINSKLFEYLKIKHKPKLSDFKEFLAETKRIIKINEEFIIDEKSKYLDSEAVVYSLVLRLRGLFIIKSILNKNKYSHKIFKSWIKSNLPEIDFKSIYEAYNLSKNDKKIKQKIKLSDVKLLIKFLKSEVNLLNG